MKTIAALVLSTMLLLTPPVPAIEDLPDDLLPNCSLTLVDARRDLGQDYGLVVTFPFWTDPVTKCKYHAAIGTQTNTATEYRMYAITSGLDIEP